MESGISPAILRERSKPIIALSLLEATDQDHWLFNRYIGNRLDVGQWLFKRNMEFNMNLYLRLLGPGPEPSPAYLLPPPPPPPPLV